MKVIKFAPGLIPVFKHAMHDQKTHGSWASGNKGGSGFTHRMMFELKRNRTDPMARQVYEAEEKNHSQIQNDTPSPTAPNRADFEEYDDYNNAYKKYSKDFLNWSRESTASLISPMAQKHLDGTPRGVTAYVRDVLRQDWFLEAFGDGGEAKPTIAMSPTRDGAAGAYEIGYKNGTPYSRIKINTGYSKNEPTIIHEIAHYATTISATTNHDGHGRSFARNHIFIAGKVMGQDFADGLEKAYREAGVDIGD
jgi:hypothetical protein